MNEPKYYNQDGLSPLKAFELGLLSHDEYIGFIKGNVIKYVVRCDKKGQGVSDIDKAIAYLTLLKKEMKAEESKPPSISSEILEWMDNVGRYQYYHDDIVDPLTYNKRWNCE